MSTGGIAERLEDVFAGRPENRAAIEYHGRTITYRELADASHAINAALSDAGVRKGSRVGVLAEDRSIVVASLLGILERGAIFVPLDPAHPTKYLEQLAETAELHCVMSDDFVMDGRLRAAALAPTIIALSRDSLFSSVAGPVVGSAVPSYGP